MEHARKSPHLPADWILVAQADLAQGGLVLEDEGIVIVRASGSAGRDLIRARRALRLAQIL